MSHTYIKQSSEKSKEDQYEKMMRIFAKTTPIKVSEAQRVTLILKANKIFNEGDIEKARLVFSAIHYYDGMVRVAKEYYKKGRILESFAVFFQAGAKKEVSELSQHIAQSVSQTMKN